MNMVISFPQSRTLPARGGLARRRKGVLLTVLRHILDRVSLYRDLDRSLTELQAMDDRMLRDIGLRREEFHGLRGYGRLPDA